MATDADFVIRIAVDRKRGIWAYMLIPRRHRSFQVAGQLDASASRQTLQAAALIASLRSIKRRTIGAMGLDPYTRPSVQIVTFDAELGATVINLVKNAESSERGHIGRNFRDELARQIKRFKVGFAHDIDKGSLLSLLNWARMNVFQGRYIEAIPTAFRPVAASQLLPASF